ncbi:MAG: L,D-transpeptidase [Candidatus Nanoarchaeia archaeon]|nr:L,D-transpeptidase [Candidatus Nanoarchaeia archaeon]
MKLRNLLAGLPLIAGCCFNDSLDSERDANSSSYEAAPALTEEAQPLETILEQAPELQIPVPEISFQEEQSIEEPLPEEQILQEMPIATDRKLVSQKVVVNIPEYHLWLYNTYSDGNTEVDFDTTVGVGRGYLYSPCPGRSYCTPPFTPIGEGWLNAKVWGLQIKYTHGPKRGQVVQWNDGFDEEGNYRRERINYSRIMRGVTTRVNVMQPYGKMELMHNYVLHTTYDEFTIGMPSSGGCARIKKQEMLDLYSRIDPNNESGFIRQRIPIEFRYDVVQLDENNILHLHANIYDKPIDWIEEIKKDMQEAGFSCTLDEHALQYRINEQDAEFRRVQQEIRDIYTRESDENFVSRELKAGLHAEWRLREFCIEDIDWLSSL